MVASSTISSRWLRMRLTSCTMPPSVFLVSRLSVTSTPTRMVSPSSTGATIFIVPPRKAIPVPWMSPVCMIRPSLRAKVSAPGAARRPKTDSRLTYSMSMNSGSVKPHRFTKLTMSVSDTVRASVRGTSPILCCSKVAPSLRLAAPWTLRRLAEVRAANLGVLGELGGGARQHDAAGFQHVAPVGDAQRHRGVLLDQQDRGALAVDRADRVEDLLDQHRSQSHRGLIQQQQARPSHERASDRQHLLLAAGEGAGHLRDALLQPGEQDEHALQIVGDPGVVPQECPHDEVLAHGEAVEDAPALRHVANPQAHHGVGRAAGEHAILQVD